MAKTSLRNLVKRRKTKKFPFGELDPDGGFKVGDWVGLIYSDHEDYIFDNPQGIVTNVEDTGDGTGDAIVTVNVSASIGDHRVYLIARPQAPTGHRPCSVDCGSGD